MNDNRKKILELLSQSAIYGNLGLFIGSGFSKAVLDEALSWGSLLRQAAHSLEISYEYDKDNKGLDYPYIATDLCNRLSIEKKIEYKKACSELKNKISEITAWYPSKEKREKFSNYLSRINPSWIITTNYDLILESLLTGKCLPLGPEDQLLKPTGIIPIYHLHGIRTNPESIVVTQEDYIKLFRPAEYRQIKLSLTVKESTVLILGYNLHDSNVLTALDWSQNVFKNNNNSYPHGVVQILRSKNNSKRREEPYDGNKDGILILEVSNLNEFFDEFLEVLEEKQHKNEKEKKEIGQLSEKLDNPDKSMIDQFIDKAEIRQSILSKLIEFENYLISSFISFLSRCLEEAWIRSKKPKNFEGYAHYLEIILDVLIILDSYKISPSLFESVAYAFQKVVRYIGENSGQSWKANEIWDKRKEKLQPKTIKELKLYSEKQGNSLTVDFLKNLEGKT